MPTESERQRDTRIRLTVFTWLEEQTEIHGDVLPWSLLAQGLYTDGGRVPLVSQQGIFKPRVLPALPLSIRTSAEGPYDDHFGRDGETLLYAYRGTDPMHPDNVRLRKTMAVQVPLVYCHGVVAGKYLAGPAPAVIAAETSSQPAGRSSFPSLAGPGADLPHPVATAAAQEATTSVLMQPPLALETGG